MIGLAVLLSYLIGSISFSYVIVRLAKGIDIRQYGSGNAGATNTLRVVGKGPAVLVFLLDGVKGMLAVGLGYWLDGSPAAMILSGLAAIVGHNWPIFLGFRGGKGIATTIGVMAVLTFQAALISGIFAIASIVLTRYVSLGSLIFVVGLPIMIGWIGYPSPYFTVSLVIALLAVIRHSRNIRSLLAGTERRLGSKERR
ncbi:glycerol-3-phosphate 1-O-acyltransferase PlsY [Polycladomyces sp. WAk]|uniref:Glycerol-3-phosphate acyltransferase n=1 Tax=Polycladomyces zharkentensis TaxID=2807616 RepID=A0ABS2WJG3_9BACL|nr:glycerol-3-phosphate 1-O-acyltransferase PlsY [Polycladomyces sp. WAk]MBN2909692.1 glycerol-3-phosphate 1-O-acyltransferase PlsY [Polycladomyces sp. WAk]